MHVWGLIRRESNAVAQVTFGWWSPRSQLQRLESHGHCWDDSMNDPHAMFGNAITVRHVQPIDANKAYVCPGCESSIEPGIGHQVVVPDEAPDLRRHWHTQCWRRYLVAKPYRSEP
jgi:hypothetical protein